MLVSNIALAQRSLKYENVAKRADLASNKEEAFGLYSDFLSANPASDRANLYYKLAELASLIMRDFNPLTDYRKMKELYLKSTDYYKLCEHYITDDNARKDQSLFQMVRPAQRRISAHDVTIYIGLKRESDSAFFVEASAIFNSYTSMINLYYNNMELYREMCANNRTINDIYINMIHNRRLLEKIIIGSDSMIVFKTALNKKLPNLSFLYKNIEKFQIDGFTPANFKMAAELWDYKTWAAEQILYYDRTIEPLLQAAADLATSFDKHIENINNLKKPVAKTFEQNEESLLGKLANIQNISSMYSEIIQKGKVINFLNLFYDARNKPLIDSASTSDGQLLYLASLTEAYNKIVAGDAEMKLNYPKLHIAETAPVAELYRRALENCKQYLINAENLSENKDYASHNKTNIPKFRGTGFYRPTNPGYITKNILKTDAGLFLGGATVSIQGFAVAYTAFADDAQNIKWIKTTDIAKLIYDDCTMALCYRQSEIMSLVTSKSVSDPTLTTQTIVKYDIKGNEKGKITLPEKNLPLARHIMYDEISETTLLVFYGDNEDWYQDSALLVVKQLSKDNQQIFKSEIKLNGKLLNIFPSNNGQFIIFGNYAEFDTPTGKKNTPGIFSILLDNVGKVLKTTSYDTKNSQYGIYAGKYAPNKFMVVGSVGELVKNDALPHPIAGEPVLIFTNENGEVDAVTK
jgi:hypothetical protein